MKSRKVTLLESLNNKLGNQLEVRRYNLSDIISESYRTLYACQSDSNLYRLVESHLADVRKNPKDIDRLSRQLCLVREIARMVESKELKDEDLVDKEKYDTVKPKKERALDLNESKDDEDVEEKDGNDVIDESASSTYTWGDWQTERGSSCRVRYYSSGIDLTNQTIGIIYEETKEQPYYGAEIYDNSSASTIEERADDSYHFDTEKEAMEWVEEWFRANESKDDEDEDLLEDSDLTEEEVEELTKHLRQIRKDRKTNPTSQTEACDKKKSGTLNEDQTNYKVYQLIMDVAFPTDLAASLKGAISSGSEVFNAISGALEEHGLEMAGDYIEIDHEVTDIYVDNDYEFFTECDDPKKSVEESTKPRKLKKANESAPVWSRYHIVNPDGETIDSYTDRKDAEEWVKQLYKDGDYKKGDLKVVDSQAKNESKSYDNLNLSEFNKKSSSKAFVKTFKKLDSKLHEGTALTRQESIALYKAANSAMTHLSVELEHNPEFLATFRESVELLSTDVNKLLGSLKEGKAPSKATMKSLAKFSEALLREDEEEDVVDSPEIDDEEFISDEEGEINSEEAEDFDQEYADARVELHKELADDYADNENPDIQNKLEQDKEEIVSLPGITDEQVADLTGEDSTEVEDSEETPDDVEEKKEEDLDLGADEDITDDELAELKKHLTEMRKAKRSR